MKKKYEDIINFCLLMSIGEKFLSILHEQSIHFIYGYLKILTQVDELGNSPKRITNKNDFMDDGGHFLENLLFGQTISQLRITNVIALFDGISIQKSQSEFSKIFNANYNKTNLMKMINESSGFLKVFLENFSIDFKYIFGLISELKNVLISTKGETEPYIEVPVYRHCNYKEFSETYEKEDEKKFEDEYNLDYDES